MATEDEAREAADGTEVQVEAVDSGTVDLQTHPEGKLSSIVETKNVEEAIDSTEGTLKIPEDQVLVEAPSEVELPPDHNLNGEASSLNGHIGKEKIANEQLHQEEAALDRKSTDQSNGINEEEVTDGLSHGQSTIEDSIPLKHEDGEEPKGDDRQDLEGVAVDDDTVHEDKQKTDSAIEQTDNGHQDQNLESAEVTEETQPATMDIPDSEVVAEAPAGVQTPVTPNLYDSDAAPETTDEGTEINEQAKAEDTSITEAEHTEEVIKVEDQQSKEADATDADVAQEEMPKCEKAEVQEEMSKSEHADVSTISAQELLNQGFPEENGQVNEKTEETEPDVNIHVQNQESLEEIKDDEAVDTEPAVQQNSVDLEEAVPEDQHNLGVTMKDDMVQEDTLKALEQTDDDQQDQDLEPTEVIEDTQPACITNVPDTEVIAEAPSGVQTLVEPNLDSSDAVPDSTDGNLETDDSAKVDNAIHLDHKEGFPEDTSIAEHAEEVIKSDDQQTTQADATNADVVQEKMSKSENVDELMTDAQEELNQESAEESNGLVNERTEETANQSNTEASEEITSDHDATSRELDVNIQDKNQDPTEKIEDAEAVDTEAEVQPNSAAFEAIPKDHGATTEPRLDIHHEHNVEPEEINGPGDATDAETTNKSNDENAVNILPSEPTTDIQPTEELEQTKTKSTGTYEMDGASDQTHAVVFNKLAQEDATAVSEQKVTETEELKDHEATESEDSTEHAHDTTPKEISAEDDSTANEPHKNNIQQVLEQDPVAVKDSETHHEETISASEDTGGDEVTTEGPTCDRQEVDNVESTEDKEHIAEDITEVSNVAIVNEADEEKDIAGKHMRELEPEETENTEPVETKEASDERHAAPFNDSAQEDNTTESEEHRMNSTTETEEIKSSETEVAPQESNACVSEEPSAEDHIIESEKNCDTQEVNIMEHSEVIEGEKDIITVEICDQSNMVFDGESSPEHNVPENETTTDIHPVQEPESEEINTELVEVNEASQEMNASVFQLPTQENNPATVESHESTEVSNIEATEVQETPNQRDIAQPEEQATEEIEREPQILEQEAVEVMNNIEATEPENISQQNIASTSEESAQEEIETENVSTEPDVDHQQLQDQELAEFKEIEMDNPEGITSSITVSASAESTSEDNTTATKPSSDTQAENLVSAEVTEDTDNAEVAAPEHVETEATVDMSLVEEPKLEETKESAPADAATPEEHVETEATTNMSLVQEAELEDTKEMAPTDAATPEEHVETEEIIAVQETKLEETKETAPAKVAAPEEHVETEAAAEVSLVQEPKLEDAPAVAAAPEEHAETEQEIENTKEIAPSEATTPDEHVISPVQEPKVEEIKEIAAAEVATPEEHEETEQEIEVIKETAALEAAAPEEHAETEATIDISPVQESELEETKETAPAEAEAPLEPVETEAAADVSPVQERKVEETKGIAPVVAVAPEDHAKTEQEIEETKGIAPSEATTQEEHVISSVHEPKVEEIEEIAPVEVAVPNEHVETKQEIEVIKETAALEAAALEEHVETEATIDISPVEESIETEAVADVSPVHEPKLEETNGIDLVVLAALEEHTETEREIEETKEIAPSEATAQEEHLISSVQEPKLEEIKEISPTEIAAPEKHVETEKEIEVIKETAALEAAASEEHVETEATIDISPVQESKLEETKETAFPEATTPEEHVEEANIDISLVHDSELEETKEIAPPEATTPEEHVKTEATTDMLPVQESELEETKETAAAEATTLEEHVETEREIEEANETALSQAAAPEEHVETEATVDVSPVHESELEEIKETVPAEAATPEEHVEKEATIDTSLVQESELEETKETAHAGVETPEEHVEKEEIVDISPVQESGLEETKEAASAEVEAPKEHVETEVVGISPMQESELEETKETARVQVAAKEQAEGETKETTAVEAAAPKEHVETEADISPVQELELDETKETATVEAATPEQHVETEASEELKVDACDLDEAVSIIQESENTTDEDAVQSSGDDTLQTSNNIDLITEEQKAGTEHYSSQNKNEKNGENITLVEDRDIKGEFLTERSTEEASQAFSESDSQAAEDATEKDDMIKGGEQTSDDDKSPGVELQLKTCEMDALSTEKQEDKQIGSQKEELQADEQKHEDERDDFNTEPLLEPQNAENGATNQTEDIDAVEAEKTEAVIELVKNEQAPHIFEESTPSSTSMKVENVKGTDEGTEEDADAKNENKDEQDNAEKDDVVAKCSTDEQDKITDEITNEELQPGLVSSVQETPDPDASSGQILENDPVASHQIVDSGDHREDKEFTNNVNDALQVIQAPEEFEDELEENKEMQNENDIHHDESQTKPEDEEAPQLCYNNSDTKIEDTTTPEKIIHDNTGVQPREIEEIGENKGLESISTPFIETSIHNNVEQGLSSHLKVDESTSEISQNILQLETESNAFEKIYEIASNENIETTNIAVTEAVTIDEDNTDKANGADGAPSGESIKTFNGTTRDLDVSFAITESKEENMIEDLDDHNVALPVHPALDENTPQQAFCEEETEKETESSEKLLPTEPEEKQMIYEQDGEDKQDENQNPNEKNEEHMQETEIGDVQKGVEQDLPVSHFLMNLILGKENNDANGNSESEAERKQGETIEDDSYVVISKQEESLVSFPTENKGDDNLTFEEGKHDIRSLEETQETVKEQNHDLKLETEGSVKTDEELNKIIHDSEVPAYQDNPDDKTSGELSSEAAAGVYTEMESREIEISSVELDNRAIDTICQENREVSTNKTETASLKSKLNDLTNAEASGEETLGKEETVHLHESLPEVESSGEETLGKEETVLLHESLPEDRSAEEVSEQTHMLTESGTVNAKDLSSDAESVQNPICAKQDEPTEPSIIKVTSTPDSKLDSEEVDKKEEEQHAEASSGEVPEEHVESSHDNLQKSTGFEVTSDEQSPQITEPVCDTEMNLADEKETSEGSTCMDENQNSNFPIKGIENLQTAVEIQADVPNTQINQDKQDEAAGDETAMEAEKLGESNFQEHQENGTEQKYPEESDEGDQQFLVKNETVAKDQEVHETVESHKQTVSIKSNEEPELLDSTVQERDLNMVSPKEACESEENFVDVTKPEFSTDEEQSPKADSTYDEKIKDIEGTKNFADEAAVKLEAPGAAQKVTRKKHNLLSGVGSKVKHQLAKVKKAIVGKPGQTKPVSPKKA